ncbi:unnamed protein product [Calypogeia fissa]
MVAMKNIKMNITTRTSTMVPPISETPHMDVWNSNVDLLRSMHVATVYFYRSTGAPDFFDGDIMREAIGKALVLFFPAAGRLARQEDGRTAIRCEGQGVLFVEADSDACIDDFGDFACQPAIQQLIPPVQTTDGIPSYPLYLFQVTRFKCGGVSFGVKAHHYVKDGVAGIQFINTISDFARGAPVTVIPWVDRTLLRARNPPTPMFPHVEYLPAPGLLPLKSNGTDFSPSVIKANGANFTAPETKSNGVRNGVHAASEKANGTNYYSAPETKSNGVTNGVHAASEKANGTNYYSAQETKSNGVSNGVHAVSDKTNGTNFAALETKSNGVRNGVHAASEKANGTNYYSAPETKSNGVTNGVHAASEKANGTNYYSAPETKSNGVTNGVHAASEKANGTNYYSAPETKSNGVANGVHAASEKANGTNYYSAPETKSNGVSNGVHAVSDKTNGTNFAALETKSNGVRSGLRAAGDKVAVAPLEVAVVVLSEEKLATLKRKVLSKENSIRYSTYEILSAHIWKCVTRARELDGAQPTKLYIVIDGRARLVPPVPQDYFGNVVFHTTPMSTAGEIVHHPMSYAAGQIHNALARMDDEYVRSALDHLELQPDLTKVVRNAHLGGDPNLSITSWARLPIYDCDFGWGRPIFMGPARINYDGIVHVLPSPVNDGSLTLSVGMRSDYMHKFQELILNVEDAE